MSALKTRIPLEEIETLGIYQAATMDGYWEDKALNDLQLIYLKGQLRATESIHSSYGSKSTGRRIKRLKREIKELEEASNA